MRFVRVTGQPELSVVLQRPGPEVGVDAPPEDECSQGMHDLDVQEVRSAHDLTVEASSDSSPHRASRTELHGSRGIDDDHASRPLRTAAITSSVEMWPDFSANRSSSSSWLGRSAIAFSSLTRYSERDSPDRAARAFSKRWVRSGMLRICTIFVTNAC